MVHGIRRLQFPKGRLHSSAKLRRFFWKWQITLLETCMYIDNQEFSTKRHVSRRMERHINQEFSSCHERTYIRPFDTSWQHQCPTIAEQHQNQSHTPFPAIIFSHVSLTSDVNGCFCLQNVKKNP